MRATSRHPALHKCYQLPALCAYCANTMLIFPWPGIRKKSKHGRSGEEAGDAHTRSWSRITTVLTSQTHLYQLPALRASYIKHDSSFSDGKVSRASQSPWKSPWKNEGESLWIIIAEVDCQKVSHASNSSNPKLRDSAWTVGRPWNSTTAWTVGRLASHRESSKQILRKWAWTVGRPWN